MYTLNNQHDHAINLRSNIGDWFKVEKLVRSNFAEDRRLEWICKKIGYYFYERQKFARAVPYFSRSKHIIKLAECLYLLENFTSLERVADRINEDCEASSALAHFFSTAGMCKQAVISYLHANNIESAILACIATNRWEHAKIVTGSHGFNQSMVSVQLSFYTYHINKSPLLCC
jgi:WD repeat-containing protein 35